MKNHNVLITGGAGYIGSVLCDYLLKKGYKVSVLDNFNYSQNSLLFHCSYKNFSLIKGDVRDKNILKQAIKNKDTIIPLAAIVGAPACEADKKLAIDINLRQIQNIVKFSSKDQFILLPVSNSGYGVSNDNIALDEKSPLKPISHYGITKVMAEKEIMGRKNSVSLRLATVFGPSFRMRTDLLVNDFTLKAYRDNYIVLFEPNFKRNYIHVMDIAILMEKIISKPLTYRNKIFNVGLSSANLSKLELCNKIKKYIPNLAIEINEFNKDKDQRNYIISNEKIEATGWKPKYSLDDGITSLIKVYSFLRQNHYNNL